MKPCLILLTVLFLIQGCFTEPAKNDASPVRLDIMSDSTRRACYLHRPAKTPSGKAPLFIVLHGAGGSPKGLMKITGRRFNELADIHGLYIAYPEGIKKTWNDFRRDPGTYAYRRGIDDTGFISLLIDRLVADYMIDAGRVYVIGFSNGGFMTLRLACEIPQKIAGIAVIAATLPADQPGICRPAKPLDVVIFNGTDDPIVPYGGGGLMLLGKTRGRILSTDATVRYWQEINGCAGTPMERDLPDTDPADGTRVREITYVGCGSGTRVRLYSITGGGHAWPGGSQYLSERFIGNASRDINACDAIYGFFCGNEIINISD